jgi:hypothetical protein
VVALKPSGCRELAPFIYFDAAPTYGVNNGAIQVELAASTVLPDGSGAVRIDVLITAHLRCSPTAAMSLREAIDKVPGDDATGSAASRGARAGFEAELTSWDPQNFKVRPYIGIKPSNRNNISGL